MDARCSRLDNLTLNRYDKRMAINNEKWRPVPCRDGMYEVSDLGRVRSLDRVVTRIDGRTCRYRGKTLNPSTARTPDYPVVYLGNGRSARVHNLVLESFVGPRPTGMVACHNDGNHHNNRLRNLRWDSYSANNHDLVKHNTHWHASKTHCKNRHEFSPENTYKRRDGGRKCKQCTLDSNRRRSTSPA